MNDDEEIALVFEMMTYNDKTEQRETVPATRQRTAQTQQRTICIQKQIQQYINTTTRESNKTGTIQQ